MSSRQPGTRFLGSLQRLHRSLDLFVCHAAMKRSIWGMFNERSNGAKVEAVGALSLIIHPCLGSASSWRIDMVFTSRWVDIGAD